MGMCIAELGTMMVCVYSLWLVWKYRRTHPSVLAWSLFAIAHLPAFPYLGWHYTIAAWFMRCTFWGVLVHLVWLDTKGYLPALQKRLPLLVSRRTLVEREARPVGAER